jgi:hypothetical protein
VTHGTTRDGTHLGRRGVAPGAHPLVEEDDMTTLRHLLSTRLELHHQHATERALLRAASRAATPSARQELLVLESLSHR